MAETEDADKSEEASPFKLQRAREKGQVARGLDLGAFGSLVAVTGLMFAAGASTVQAMTDLMRRLLSGGVAAMGQPGAQPAPVLAAAWWPAMQPMITMAVVVMAVGIFLQILQLRGLIFTFQPLKPDFSRLNPAKGLKRIFSLKMLKETAKNIAKLIVYSLAAGLLIMKLATELAPRLVDGGQVAGLLQSGAGQLLALLLLIALVFTLIDQWLSRREFAKQMRMSRREQKRESRDREGDPEIKSKRKALAAELRRQGQGAQGVPGADLLIVNPEHYAVALRYRPGEDEAPRIRARGRNRFALAMREAAIVHGVAIIADPPLARALWKQGQVGQPIPPAQYQAVADHYIRIREMDTQR